MSSVVLFSEGHIAFSKNVLKVSYTLIRMPLDAWVCSEGLVIPMSTSSFNACGVFDGKKTGIPGQAIFTIGMLVRLDGTVSRFMFDSVDGVIDKDVQRFTYEMPVSEGVQWCSSEFDSYEEKAYAALLASPDRESALKNLETADLLMAREIEWYKLSTLVEQINVIHKKKYPDHSTYAVKP